MTGGELFSVAERYLSDPVVRTAVRSSRPQPRGRCPAAQIARFWPCPGKSATGAAGRAGRPHGHRVGGRVVAR